jgi:multiple sugar transport system permease protein
MSLIGKVGRRRPRARFALFVIYLVLCLGAVTTIYPFLLMLSTGFKGPTDQNDDKLVPRYWSTIEAKDEKGKLAPESLYGKYLADKYANDTSMIASTRIGSVATLEVAAQYEKFLMSLPLDYFAVGFRLGPAQVTGRLATRYQSWLRDRYKTIDALNRAYIDENTDFQTVAPPNELLERKAWGIPKDRKYREWLEFKKNLPAEFRIPVRAERLFQDFLKSKYKNQLTDVPPETKGSAKSFEEIALPKSGPLLLEFKAKTLPARYAQATLEDLWASHASLPIPIDAYERAWVTSHAGEIRREFTGRNYRYVVDYIALNGRSLWNTLIFCGLAILTQLIVNPLAAFALSRYPIRASGKILLFLLATMAFPAEVAMIPSFLLLKQLNLLNTFAALVLPSAASGYMIFLLKGFFDSLPQELFEAGQIDGAKESTMMFKIALPLSKPVLGYIALIAFMASYGSFLYAFLVAQDQRIWTLMVWIYNLQSYAPKSVTMAALVIAALPTLIVFLLAQRVIMRGIILPNER